MANKALKVAASLDGDRQDVVQVIIALLVKHLSVVVEADAPTAARAEVK